MSGALLMLALWAQAPQALADETWRGVDLSYVNELEDCGAVYRYQGRVRDPFEIFAAKGANLARFRLWHSPDWTKYSTLADVKRSIRRAKGHGMRVLLDFHYSDDWADPEKQKIPAAWRDADSDNAVAALLYRYTFDTLMSLHDEGLLPEFVQVGNEINHGLARTDPEADAWWNNPVRNVKLLNAGISAVRKVGEELGRDIGIVLHVAQPENVESWLDRAADAGLLDFDIIGISYYSQWSVVPLAALGRTLQRLRHKYGKKVAVVETAYVWTLDWNDKGQNILWKDSLEPGYPATPHGQRKYLIDLMRAVLQGGGLGMVYWEPAWISTSCETRWFSGSAWENAALFDYKQSELHEGADYLDHDFGLAVPAHDAEVAGTLELLEHWLFYRYGQGERFNVEQVPESGWTEVRVPHTAHLEPRVIKRQWQGDALYRHQLFADPEWRNRAVWLRFEAAMRVAKVYLNGELVAEHLGGYLPFTIDLSHKLEYGRENEVLVHLDNRDNPISGPKPLQELDFNTHGGLYRQVTLSVRDKLHITDEMLADSVASGGVFVTYPQVSKQTALVSVRTHVANEHAVEKAFRIRHRLLYGGEVMASFESDELLLAAGESGIFEAAFRVPQPHLWSPRSPSLYDLHSSVSTGGIPVDARETRIGIREIELSRDGLRVNGEKMFLRGVNRHQEYPYVGYAISPQAEYRDAKLIKEAGFDYVRLSHYPHSPHFMRAADELGLLLLNAVLGWQYFNENPAFSTQVVKTCRDLVRRDRNHPSVLAWECSLNESAMPDELVVRLHNAVHEEYPGGLAYSAGWVPDIYDVFIEARQHRLRHPDAEIPDKPYLVSEYGDWEYYAQNAGLDQAGWRDLKEAHRSSRQLLAHGERRLLQQATNVQEAHNDNYSTAAFADGYWAMFDYNRGYAEDLEASGLMSIERIAKPAYQFFRSQRDADEASRLFDSGPMVHIANAWRPDSPLAVRVFSNCDEVELILNGETVARRSPNRDRISNRLRHPPFNFELSRFEAGTLRAIGYIDGKAVAEHGVQTPGAPAEVRVELAKRGVAPVLHDLVFAHASIVDDAGVRVPLSGRMVRFKVGAGLEIVGPSEVLSEHGFAAVLVRVTDVGASLEVTAEMP